VGEFFGDVVHDTYEIDVENGRSASLFRSAVGGATYDATSERVLFTFSDAISNAEFEGLWTWPTTGGEPLYLGAISSVSGTLRTDGLAISAGTLYGVHQFDDETGLAGIYEIDPGTLAASLVMPLTHGSIGGIDADPLTGVIYGVDDNQGALVEIDITGGITVVASYVGEDDIDGLAIGNDGRAYLVPDDPDPGLIQVYNLNTDSYDPPLPAPWQSAETFSGAAFIYGSPDLVLRKDDGGGGYLSGQAIPYTLDFTNISAFTAQEVTIQETVPDHASFSASASTPGWDCPDGSPAGTTCNLSIGELNGGASGSATFGVVLNDPVLPDVHLITNTAVITYEGIGGPDPNPEDNFAIDDSMINMFITYMPSLFHQGIP
jgi:hypothetical protein